MLPNPNSVIWLLIGLMGTVLISRPVLAAENFHPCAFGPSLVGVLDNFGRGDTFTIRGSRRQFHPAGLVFAEIGGDLAAVLAAAEDEIELYLGDMAIDRYGRQPVFLFHDGEWVQGNLLQSGDALAYPTTKNHACRQALLDAESKNTARRSQYWRTRGVEIDATDLNTLSVSLGRFVMVTGVVRSVGDRTKRLYLNFGENWAHDFTASVAKQGVGKFTGDLKRLLTLTGRKVQIRGVLEDNRGPLIRVIDDVQVQIIK